jgi:hypothetical protein
MLVKLTLIGVGLVIAIVAAWRRSKMRAHRRIVKREVRKIWQEARPGELYPECPVCRLPFPTSFTQCPFCARSRVRARAERRDVDWAIETATGYLSEFNLDLTEQIVRPPDDPPPPSEPQESD